MVNQLTSDELIARYNAGERDFSRCMLIGQDFHCANLPNINLRYAALTHADLSLTDLSNADLRGAELDKADLSDANLNGANLEVANLYRADLTDAGLSGVLNPPASSHDFIAEVLRQNAEHNVERLMIAGLVLVSREWCWRRFGTLAQEEWSAEIRAWIVETLSPWPRFKTSLHRYGFVDIVAAQGNKGDKENDN